MELYSILVLVVSTWIFVSALLRFARGARSKRKLPPGPAGIPLVGSLHKLGTNPNQSLAQLAKTHGPLMTMQLGSITTIVVSSSKMAKVFLQKYDQVFSGRTVPDAVRVVGHDKAAMGWTEGQHWRYVRKISNTEIFTTQRLDALRGLRRRKVDELVKHVRDNCRTGRPVDIGHAAFITTLNMMSNTVFSIDLVNLNSETGEHFRDAISGIMEESGKPNISDYFPVLRPLDLQGIRRRMARYFKQLHAIFDKMIDQRLQLRTTNSFPKGDFLDVLLDHNQEKGSEFSRLHVKALIADMFIAGTDTSSNTVEWAMTELLRNPDFMVKARSELAKTIGRERSVEETDIHELPYLQAVVKESMRLHPTVPLLLPHRAETSIEVEQFVIPENSQVMVNGWAISRDPDFWENPTSFEPERFLGSDIDFRGRDFDYIPFGAGRRICPGLPLGVRMVHLMLASLIQSFDWKLPDGMEPEHIDMEERFGLTLQKSVPLRAVPISTGDP